MSDVIQTKFESQLPKLERWSFVTIFNYVAGICSIGGLVGAPFVVSDPNSMSFVFITFLAILVLVLLVHAFLVNRRKLHRYAQSVIFSHYVVHVIRDTLAEIEATQGKHVERATRKILDAIATCFSIIIGKHCRCTIIELVDNTELKVVARDDVSEALNKKRIGKNHLLENNTDFKNLWYALDGCSRYYLCNNLLQEWKVHRYDNSSFDEVGYPSVVATLFGLFSRVANWQLPYRSALILPIRHLTEFAPPKNSDVLESNWNFYGFLCIDCNSVNVFDNRYTPELGGMYADSLFTFFTQVELTLDQLTRPCESHKAN